MANAQRDEAKERRWREAFKRFRASGQTVREFCQQEQIAESAFYAWRRTIGERDEAGGTRRQAPAFVPAVVTSEQSREESIVIELSGGRSLRLPAAGVVARRGPARRPGAATVGVPRFRVEGRAYAAR
ncbi:MAG TPA: hypothetical protein PJ982_18780, partial [Lacipirellulaceae bacterium]|nr:hypothetical protein [Lacipirellulaceae bacterium]